MFKLSTKNPDTKNWCLLRVRWLLWLHLLFTHFLYLNLHRIGRLKYTEVPVLLNCVTGSCSPGYVELKPSRSFLKAALAFNTLRQHLRKVDPPQVLFLWFQSNDIDSLRVRIWGRFFLICRYFLSENKSSAFLHCQDNQRCRLFICIILTEVQTFPSVWILFI